jgi:phosphatidylglycerophosphate synthase
VTRRVVCVLVGGGTLEGPEPQRAVARVVDQARTSIDDVVVVLAVDAADTPPDLGVPAQSVARRDIVGVLARVAGDAASVAVVAADVVAHDRCVATVLCGPGAGARVLVGTPTPSTTTAPGVLLDSGYVIGCTASGAAPALLGVLRVAGADLCAAADVTTGQNAVSDDPMADVVHALLRARRDVAAVDRRGFVAERPTSADARAAAECRVAEVDEERAARDAAVKAHDGFFTTFFVSPYSRHVAAWCARRGLTPNQVTSASMVLGVLAAVAFAGGGTGARVVGAVTLQLAFTLDCVDGQLARYSLRFSGFGGWLDGIFDRAKEYLVYVGLAIGAVRSGGDPDVLWLLVAATMALQTLRHHLDLAYNAQAGRERTLARRERAATGDVEATGASDNALIAAAHGLNRVPVMRWGKLVITLPIGERLLLISIVSVIGGAQATLIVLLAWGALAGAYTALGRILRSRS